MPKSKCSAAPITINAGLTYKTVNSSRVTDVIERSTLLQECQENRMTAEQDKQSRLVFIGLAVIAFAAVAILAVAVFWGAGVDV